MSQQAGEVVSPIRLPVPHEYLCWCGFVDIERLVFNGGCAENNRRTAELLGQPPLIDQGSLEQRHQKQIRYLSAVVRDPNNSSTLMLRAVKSMGQVKDKSAIAALQEIITTHSNPAIRKQATRALSHVLARQYE